MRGLRFFDDGNRSPTKFKHRGKRSGCPRLLKVAKKKVFDYLGVLEKQVLADKISPFERAWFEASGENKLNFNFAGMREDVNSARYGYKDFEEDDLGWNDGASILINKKYPLRQRDLEHLLLHEAMHGNITRARQGHVFMNEDMEHLAMALLGDRDERANLKLGWYDCVFGANCSNPAHFFKDDEEEKRALERVKRRRSSLKKKTRKRRKR